MWKIASPPVTIAIFWLAIVSDGIAPSALADGAAVATHEAHPPTSEDVQDCVVPATTPPQTLDAKNKNKNKNSDAPAPAGGDDPDDSKKKAAWWAYTHVHLVNELSGGRAMTVHCKSKNDDMGIHVVPPGSEYQWRFRPSIFGNTLFWCHVAKDNVQIVYDAYYNNDDKLWERVYMDNSYWVAKDDALYLRQFWKNNNDIFWRRWP